MSGRYIYILASHTGTLYSGVTRNLYLRVMQDTEGTLVVENVRAAWVRQASTGFLRLRSGQALRLRATSAVSGDNPVTRFAQDDDFLGISTKNILDTLTLMERNPG
jgi:hypothetical protein